MLGKSFQNCTDKILSEHLRSNEILSVKVEMISRHINNNYIAVWFIRVFRFH